MLYCQGFTYILEIIRMKVISQYYNNLIMSCLKIKNTYKLIS